MGEERYAQIMSVYYRGAQAAILVYDITNESTFTNLPNWLSAIRKFSKDKNVILTLVGNKLDFSDRRKVPTKLGRQFAESNEMMFLETSAKTGENVQELFYEIARNLAAKLVKTELSQSVVVIREVLDTSRQEQRRCCLFSSNNQSSSSSTSPQSPTCTFSFVGASHASPKMIGNSASFTELFAAEAPTKLSINQQDGVELVDHSLSRTTPPLQVLGECS